MRATAFDTRLEAIAGQPLGVWWQPTQKIRVPETADIPVTGIFVFTPLATALSKYLINSPSDNPEGRRAYSWINGNGQFSFGLPAGSGGVVEAGSTNFGVARFGRGIPPSTFINYFENYIDLSPTHGALHAAVIWPRELDAGQVARASRWLTRRLSLSLSLSRADFRRSLWELAA